MSGWQRILLVRLDNMGDVLMCTPAMQALRDSHPEARFTLLTSPAGARLAPHLEMIDDVIVHKASWVKHGPGVLSDDESGLIAKLREGAFDAAFIFTTCTQSALPMAMLCRIAGVPHRMAHCRENPYELLTTWAPETDVIGPTMRHEVQRQLDLVALAGVAPPADTRLRFKVVDADRQRVRALLSASGWDAGRPYVVLHPGATAASRRYPASSFGLAMTRLLHAGWACVLCGTAEDQAAVDELAAMLGTQAPDQVLNLGGRLTLGDMAALIADARLLVANNSGPMHIGAAVGTPVVCLYALTNPQHTPWGVPARVLFHDVPCRNCLRSVCPLGHHACLLGVQPDEVAEAALSLLSAEPLQGGDHHARRASLPQH